MAFGKLQEFITGRADDLPGQNVVNIALFVVALRAVRLPDRATRARRRCSTR